MPELLSVNDIEAMQAENKELKACVVRYIEENQKLTDELKEREYEIQHKSSLIERLQGMVDAFEICVKARK